MWLTLDDRMPGPGAPHREDGQGRLFRSGARAASESRNSLDTPVADFYSAAARRGGFRRANSRIRELVSFQRTGRTLLCSSSDLFIARILFGLEPGVVAPGLTPRPTSVGHT